jgi:hypothetical protein
VNQSITLEAEAIVFPGVTFEQCDEGPSHSKGWIAVFAFAGILLYRDRFECGWDTEEEFWAEVPGLPQLDTNRRASAEGALRTLTEAAARLFWQLLEAA